MDRLTYKHDDKWCINGINGKLISDKHANYWGEAVDRLAAYENAEEQGRLIVLPEDGMLYYVEENEEDMWIGNRPIMDIVFKYGWGLVGLDCHLYDIGKKFFFSRKEAEEALRGE